MQSKNEILLSTWASLIVSHGLANKRVTEKIDGKAPLTLDEYDLLLVLSRQPQSRLRLSDLANASLYTRSGITRVKARMLSRGLLIEARCEQDKRGTFAVLTKSGSRALEETWKHYRVAILETLNTCLTHHEGRQLAMLLEKMVEQLSDDSLVQIRNSAKPKSN